MEGGTHTVTGSVLSGGGRGVVGGEEGGIMYFRMVRDLLLDKFRRAVTRDWGDVREPGGVVGMFVCWGGLLPGSLGRHLLKQLVFPKLSRAVWEWDPRFVFFLFFYFIHFLSFFFLFLQFLTSSFPFQKQKQKQKQKTKNKKQKTKNKKQKTKNKKQKTKNKKQNRRDTIPIQNWVHPWIPFLRHELRELYPNIRQKLSDALVFWSASDPSAYNILSPWKNIFDKESMDVLLVRSIVPKVIYGNIYFYNYYYSFCYFNIFFLLNSPHKISK